MQSLSQILASYVGLLILKRGQWLLNLDGEEKRQLRAGERTLKGSSKNLRTVWFKWCLQGGKMLLPPKCHCPVRAL